ncbi:MAG TPA: hypothetical protein VKS43_10275 [Burkholderiales bacterium]|nr:hypothetical protein [Burkholderiales bacterium]
MLLFLSVLVVGFMWYTVSSLSKVMIASYDRDQITGLALKSAKVALLGYVAQQAAKTTELYPGRLPCPESLSQPSPPTGSANAYEGLAAAETNNPSYPNCSPIGRLPWKTLGVDQIRDGYGVPLWYAVPSNATWAFINSSSTLTINPALTNQLSYDGTSNTVVAVIIAPGPPLNTTGLAGPPPAGCSAVNQLTNRYTVPYVVTNFLECGDATGSYTTIGPSSWSNDRTISITANEVMDAISGAISDRLQRQVAPALSNWRVTESVTNWNTSFLPYASTFSVLTTNNLCGNYGTVEGLLPTASATSGTCNTSWSTGTVSDGGLGIGTLCTNPGHGCGGSGTPTCAPDPVATPTQLKCTFSGITDVGALLGQLSVQITATAPGVASSFRKYTPASQVTVSESPSLPFGATTQVTVVSSTIATGTGVGSVTYQINVTGALIGGLLSDYTVIIPNPPDADLLSDARMTWFLNNGWPRYTYYGISSATTVNPGVNSCPVGGGAQCLVLSGVPASYGNGTSNNKNFMLTLMGRAVGAETQPSDSPAQYLESHTIVPPSLTYNYQAVGSNDRFATCPFQQTPASGTPVTICN